MVSSPSVCNGKQSTMQNNGDQIEICCLLEYTTTYSVNKYDLVGLES